MLKQFLTFCIVGTFNTGIDFGLYFVLTRFVGLYFIAANVISVLCAMTFSFFVNKKVTFKNTSTNYAKQYAQFAVINGIGFVLHNSILYTGVKFLHLHDIVAKIGAVGLVLFFNFFAMKYWAFAEVK